MVCLGVVFILLSCGLDLVALGFFWVSFKVYFSLCYFSVDLGLAFCLCCVDLKLSVS